MKWQFLTIFPINWEAVDALTARRCKKSESPGNYLATIWKSYKIFLKKVLTFSIYRSSLVVEQRANAKNRIRLPEIQYFREPLAGVKRCMSMVIILCEQCTEFLHDKWWTLGVTGLPPLKGNLFQELCWHSFRDEAWEVIYFQMANKVVSRKLQAFVFMLSKDESLF